MPTTQLPLMKGLGKNYASADYLDLLPVNMLATPKEVLDASGYLRSFPGIQKTASVRGTSRGVIFNAYEGVVYRVCGEMLYRNGLEYAGLIGTGRVSMAYSYNSHAVCAGGLYVLYGYDGVIRQVANWDPSTGYTQYDLGATLDICRNRSRYVWSKGGSDSFFVSDLEDESKPDRYSAEYRAESQPDGIIGIDNWRDFVVCFGTTTIEYFSLTGASGGPGVSLYQSQPSLMVQKGIAGTYCKTKFADSHAIISNPATGAPSVYLINSGSIQGIATASIERILNGYTSAELATGVMESLRFLAHELLIIHLPRHVLVFDGSVTQGGLQWSVLSTGLSGEPHRAIDYIYQDNFISCADKREGLLGALRDGISSQYDQHQEHLLYTPMFRAGGSRVFDFELESSTGSPQIAEKMFISATTDGINYGREQMLSWNQPFNYDRRVLWRRIGRVRKNIGFKIRVIASSPVTLSGCQVRIE
jgi:hypothetical protein